MALSTNVRPGVKLEKKVRPIIIYHKKPLLIRAGDK